MKSLTPTLLILPIVCFCSCGPTEQHSSNSISNISNSTSNISNAILNIEDISTIFDGGSTRAFLTLQDGSVWVLFYNRNLSDKELNKIEYNSIAITRVKPCRGKSVYLPKGGTEEKEWLKLLSEFQASNPQADKETLDWIDRILKEKRQEEWMRGQVPKKGVLP